MTNLYKYDLNLLTVFDMIYSEKHLTRAGQKLNLSQPAVSHALGKLRDMFGDALFIRSGKDMIPTPFADQIYQRVHEIVSLSRKVLTDRENFDPSKSNRIFKIAMNDYSEMVIMPKLYKAVQTFAPNIQLRSCHLTYIDNRALNDDIDLVIGCDLNFGSGIFQKKIFSDREVIIIKPDHQILNKELTPELYASLKHGQFRFDDAHGSHVDIELDKMGITRNIAIEVHHEMVLPLLLEESDIVVNIPFRMAEVFKKFIPFEIVELSFINKRYDFCQYWHGKNNMDDSHLWFRTLVDEVSKKL